jgi:hypothetical protein
MPDSRVMAEEYLRLADGYERRAARAIDRRVGEKLRKIAEHYCFLAVEVERARRQREGV